ncbi:unnamed protein product [Diabrotica balteata]|uniref:Endonuclease-reverse transcriptase n=1 Tax=Diabrotica balteata TaxID=107213 RepID=A0A9N9TE89_DIABA|nr:unnamed protein product [Diabrotica balteata]
MVITRKMAEQLRVTQRAINISLRDKIPNTEIHLRTKITDIMGKIATLRWQWVAHVERQDTNRWSHKGTFWRPRKTIRSVGRPKKRWIYDITAVAGKQWMRIAKDRKAWKELEEAYVQQWINEG